MGLLLQFANSPYNVPPLSWSPSTAQIGVPLVLTADPWNPAPFARSGQVTFAWSSFNTGNFPPTTLGTATVNQTEGYVDAGGIGVAQISWTPDCSVVPCNGENNVFGYIWAGVTTVPLQAGGVYYGGGGYKGGGSNGDASSIYVATKRIMVRPAGAAIAAAARRPSPSALSPTQQMFAFGIAGQGVHSVLQAHALAGPFLTRPEVNVSVGRPAPFPSKRLPTQSSFFSGLIAPEQFHARALHHQEAHPNVFRGVLAPEDTQGVITVNWPADSLGQRCMVAVTQTLLVDKTESHERLGGFLIGLQNDPNEPVWS